MIRDCKFSIALLITEIKSRLYQNSILAYGVTNKYLRTYCITGVNNTIKNLY